MPYVHHLLLDLALEQGGVQDWTAPERARLLEECREKKEGLHPNTRRLAIDLARGREGAFDTGGGVTRALGGGGGRKGGGGGSLWWGCWQKPACAPPRAPPPPPPPAGIGRRTPSDIFATSNVASAPRPASLRAISRR